jgi:aryl-alcohol dehydrogenase-like predicted oxidoreductase
MYARTEESDRKVVERLTEPAKKLGASQASLALAWMLEKPGITAPIVGATRKNHLEDAVAALSIKLTPEEVAALEEAYIPHPVLGFS